MRILVPWKPVVLVWGLLFALLTGTAVAGFVGFFQKNKPGLLAVLCLLPAILFEYLTVSGQGLSFS